MRLEQEIGCVEDYIKIQQVRYPECLDFSLECDAERKEEWVPPLLLQTFIENGIKHNITLVPRLTLHIVVRKYPGSLVFLISDTGVGFRQEMLRKLEAGEDIEENGQHIGIVNIKNRLKLLYHGRAGIKIRNREQGAAIYIRIPERREE